MKNKENEKLQNQSHSLTDNRDRFPVDINKENDLDTIFFKWSSNPEKHKGSVLFPSDSLRIDDKIKACDSVGVFLVFETIEKECFIILRDKYLFVDLIQHLTDTLLSENFNYGEFQLKLEDLEEPSGGKSIIGNNDDLLFIEDNGEFEIEELITRKGSSVFSIICNRGIEKSLELFRKSYPLLMDSILSCDKIVLANMEVISNVWYEDSLGSYELMPVLDNDSYNIYQYELILGNKEIKSIQINSVIGY